jgi:hypothetical protein
MLEPDARHLLLDILRPPPQYTLDMAVGTTYSLDLLALMTAPVAFAMFDRQRGDGSPVDDPIATLQALREHAARITLFCQAGQIAVPPAFRSLLVYLEDAVHPVVPPDEEAIFHPKVWYIRYRRRDDDAIALRLLCLSRNLTFDRSWDTVLRLDGEQGAEPKSPELARFAESLVAMAERTHPVAPDRAEALVELGDQFSRARWTLPVGFDEVRFWPLGDDGVSRWPFEGRRDRMLVVSPFVTAGTLSRLTKRHRGSILVSRPETFDALGGEATKHLAERLILSSDASTLDRDESGDDSVEAIAESAEHRLEGLHAKTYVADAGWRARVWTGSANATDAAFHGNVEFLVELGGSKDRCGVHAAVGDRADRFGLRKLVDSYEPSQDHPLEPPEAERLARRLDRARRAIGALRFTATCATVGCERWRLALAGVATGTTFDPGVFAGIRATVRPVTLGTGFATTLDFHGLPLQTRFEVSEPDITPYFAVTLEMEALNISFLVVAELVDPPPDRADRVLSSLLTNRGDLLRFLFLLVGNEEDALAGFGGDEPDGPPGETWLAGFASLALLEPLVRAYSRAPQRLREIERVMAALSHRPDAESILPERWEEIWRPIAAALGQDPDR